MVGPCIDLLRKLATQMNDTLGSMQGVKHHAPDLKRDILEVMRSLREHHVYEVDHGRTVDGDKPEVPNAIALGMEQLPGPLRDYNAWFKRMRRRRRQKPAIGDRKSSCLYLTYLTISYISTTVTALVSTPSTLANSSHYTAPQSEPTATTSAPTTAPTIENDDEDDALFAEFAEQNEAFFSFEVEEDVSMDIE